MDAPVVAAIAAVLGAVIGASGVFAKGVYDARRETAKELTQVRRRYLEPLHLAAFDLSEHLAHLAQVFSATGGDPVEAEFLSASFLKIKDLDRAGGRREDFYLWCNGEGYFAVATLYRTAKYCWAAERTKRELVFVDSPTYRTAPVSDRLEAVRSALGGKYGIWQTIQDSVGSYVSTSDGDMADYHDFCSTLADPRDHVWLLRVMDFYMYISEPGQQAVIERTLKELDRLEAGMPTKERRNYPRAWRLAALSSDPVPTRGSRV